MTRREDDIRLLSEMSRFFARQQMFPRAGLGTRTPVVSRPSRFIGRREIAVINRAAKGFHKSVQDYENAIYPKPKLVVPRRPTDQFGIRRGDLWKNMSLTISPGMDKLEELIDELDGAWPEKGRKFTQKVGRTMVRMINRRVRAGKDLKGGRFAPLREETKKNRRRRGIGGNRPLLATGDMMRSITYSTKADDNGARVIVTVKGPGSIERAKVSAHNFGMDNPMKSGNRFRRVRDIPPRTFYGLTDKEFEKIENLYVRHFNRKSRDLLKATFKAPPQEVSREGAKAAERRAIRRVGPRGVSKAKSRLDVMNARRKIIQDAANAARKPKSTVRKIAPPSVQGIGASKSGDSN